MTERTPIQKLDDAVHEYFSALGEEGDLSGWVLAWQSSQITSDPNLIPLGHNSDYTMSPSTSGELALGLASLTSRRLHLQLAPSIQD